MAAAPAAGGAVRGRGATSFQRKAAGGSRLAAVAGTRPSVRNGQLLLSSGVPSLDCVLGGGIAVGTLLLIEEDKYGLYSHLLFKYFLAEGVVCGHELFVASAKEHPDNILKELPSPLLDDNYRKETGQEATAAKSEDSQDSMKIAWRYQNLPKMEASPTPSTKFGHYYDVSKKMPPELLQSIKWHSFYLHEELSSEPKMKTWNMNSAYTRLLQSIQRIIYQEGFDGSDPQKKKNILRIGIQNLGSVLWGDDICSSDTPEDKHSLTKFLYILRGLLRKSLSACIITVPAHLIQNKAIMERVTNLSDMVVGLESFIGSERETNPLYKDYHGLVHVHQMPRLNSLNCDVSDTKDLAFRLKRKLFTIEMESRNQGVFGAAKLSGLTKGSLLAAPAFASRPVRHSEPHEQTGSGSIPQTAELRMWCYGHGQEAPGLLVIPT
ncbi:elongator complex protein 4 isoform X2 [Heliangelus exortis]|uniref:elongator complex protein 4 isoform X2 n=1 Tax=Heliangelus exortis TaxID=472823 RepID=UPI003A91F41D